MHYRLNTKQNFIRLLLFLLLLLLFKSNTFCQNTDSTKKIQINFTLWNFDLGNLNFLPKGELNKEAAYALKESSGFFMGYSGEILFVYKEKLGFILGCDNFGSFSNETDIRKNFAQYLSDFNASFKTNDFDKGIHPINQSNSYSGPKIGLSFQFNLPKMKIIPYLTSTYYTVNKLPTLEVDLIEKQTNIVSSRKYSYDENKSYGFATGIDFKFIKGNFYYGLSPLFRIFKSKGTSFFEDFDSNGKLYNKEAKSFQGNLFTFSIAIKCGFQFNFNNKFRKRNIS